MIKKQNLSQHYQTTIMDFLNNMLKADPEQRFSAEQAVNHAIFRLKENKNIVLNHNNPEIMQKLLHYKVIFHLSRYRTISKPSFRSMPV